MNGLTYFWAAYGLIALLLGTYLATLAWRWRSLRRALAAATAIRQEVAHAR